MSELTDSLTIVVSEETGKVSAASNGKLLRDLKEEELREQLEAPRINLRKRANLNCGKGG